MGYGTSTYFRSVNFSSTTTNYDLFSDANVRSALKERFSWDDTKLNEELADGIEGLFIQIYCSGTAIIVNDGIEQALIENAVWSTGDFTRTPIKSIKIKETGINGTFRFNVE